ncbi:radical SAM protein [Desulfovibrio desulfuricans]|uniref:radical SAM protein n=1 Tax=Desulfovibrio desulfuricans TaxID=876 RepID=UPI003983EDF8
MGMTLNSAQRPSQVGDKERAVPLDFAWLRRNTTQRQAVVPVFLPFRGCPVRCVFCAQDVQTGIGDCQNPDNTKSSRAASVEGLLLAARENLRLRRESGQPAAELAFYGGTFTALPEEDLSACLDLACEAQEKGWIRSFRCSTRPDRVDAPILERLRAAGCGVVELGVQSFADSALAASRRGYSGGTARAACALVRAAGLKLVVQLLPGMPGHSPQFFMDDVPTALAAGAQMLRFYPCLVLEGTGLAAMWREGSYKPWLLEDTLESLALGWLVAARVNVSVIRMGLAPEPGLEKAVLAGPVDRELGGRVKGRALLLAVRELLGENAATPATHFDLLLPRSAQGFFWGAKGELRARWAALGLRTVSFDDNISPQLVFI